MGSSNIDGLLQAAVDKGTVPGVVAVAGDRDGTLYEGAFGTLGVGDERRVRLDTVFLIASMTKAIASLAAMPFRQGFGLGLHLVLEDIPGMRRAGTGDWAGLFNCYYWIDRQAGIAGALLTQVLPFFDPQVVETGLGFEAGVYAEVGAPAAA